MIFTLQESVMNGTVTMQTMVTGVEAKDFEDAKDRVLAIMKKNCPQAIINHNNKNSLNYSIPGDFEINGYMADKPLKMLEKYDNVKDIFYVGI